MAESSHPTGPAYGLAQPSDSRAYTRARSRSAGSIGWVELRVQRQFIIYVKLQKPADVGQFLGPRVIPECSRSVLKILGHGFLQVSHLCEWLGYLRTSSLQTKHGCVDATCSVQPGHMMVSLCCSGYLALNHASSIFSQTTHRIFRYAGMRDNCFEGLLTHSLARGSIIPTIDSDRCSPQEAWTAYHNIISFVFKKDHQICALKS